MHPYAKDADCYNGEIIRKDMDKGEAMERVCEYYGADLADTVAFGDVMNDWQMPECAGGCRGNGEFLPEIERRRRCCLRERWWRRGLLWIQKEGSDIGGVTGRWLIE